MTSRERGLVKPRRGSEPGHTIAVAKETTHLPGTGGVFQPASHYPELIQETTPLLLDRTNTPRKAKREISLGRNFTNKRWLYNKTTLDELKTSDSLLDIKRGKNLGKITRKEDKAKLQYFSKRS